MTNAQSNTILNETQFAFMRAHHMEIELALIANKLGDDSTLNAFTNSEAYKEHFGAMGWDDVYDRYQDTPGYDETLRLELHRKLKEDVESGQVTFSNELRFDRDRD